ncbi:MAG: DUF1343 domain-containing protein [Deltaproteobacteria bacterium]|nr:DUF1343 domain-containing protein [Deltaproteobacteria bacterium]MBI3293402.1 DUF1343 domain-containing protein [Deltaproteobacteria bacterium]
MVKSGLDRFLETEHKRFRGQRLGLLCNQASVNSRLVHASECLTDKKLKLDFKVFFGPQHGIRGEKQDNMIESDDFVDPRTKVPIVSLYSKTREPRADQLKLIDTLVVDLQDIGCRIYTFMYTLANCMRVAKTVGCRIVVLDRPNPIGGSLVDGNVLETHLISFVGQYPMATQHGLTLGELAELFNNHFGIGCELEVIRLQGWKRDQHADQWGRDWVIPSPNIPTVDSARVFPGTVLFEGTNVSEGRGTTKPFEWVGAPFIDADRLAQAMNSKKLPGVFFRPIFFQPTYHKHKDMNCGGVQIHILQPQKLRPVGIGNELLYTIRELFGEKLQWKQPPYEYEFEKLPIDLIAGTDRLRLAVDKQAGLKDFNAWAEDSLQAFSKVRRQVLSRR